MSRRVNQFTRCRRVSSYIPISRDSPGGPENQPKPTAYFTKAASVSAEAREQGDYARWFGLTLLTGSSATAWGWATSAPWILFFTLIGTFFLLASHQGSENLSAKAIFSLDRLLPIVQLEETSKEVEAGLAGRVKHTSISIGTHKSPSTDLASGARWKFVLMDSPSINRSSRRSLGSPA